MMLSGILVIVSCVQSVEEPRYNISAILEGAHWIDGKKEDLLDIERGLLLLGGIPPSKLRLSVLDYLKYYRDSYGIAYPLRDKGVIFRRNVDIAILNRLYVSSVVPLNWDGRWGDSGFIGDWYPWMLSHGKKKLLPPPDAYDLSEDSTYDAWGEFQIVDQVLKSLGRGATTGNGTRREGREAVTSYYKAGARLTC